MLSLILMLFYPLYVQDSSQSIDDILPDGNVCGAM